MPRPGFPGGRVAFEPRPAPLMRIVVIDGGPAGLWFSILMQQQDQHHEITSGAEARARLAGSNPQQRLIAPEEVAHAVLWLCADAARGVTGQAIVVAGGEIM